MNKVCDEPLPFNVMYYHALVKEIVKEFTEQSKEVGEAFQINIFYSETQAVFIFTKKFATNGVLEARHVFPLGSESLMDRQLTSLFTTFYRTKNFNGQ